MTPFDEPIAPDNLRAQLQTIYRDRGQDLYAVRVFGTTAKVRVLRYMRETGKWQPW